MIIDIFFDKFTDLDWQRTHVSDFPFCLKIDVGTNIAEKNYELFFIYFLQNPC